MGKQLDDLKFFGIKYRTNYLITNYKECIMCAADPANFSFTAEDLEKRQQAVDEIAEIKAASDYDEVDHLAIEFE